jgi:hypothetical protein
MEDSRLKSVTVNLLQDVPPWDDENAAQFAERESIEGKVLLGCVED